LALAPSGPPSQEGHTNFRAFDQGNSEKGARIQHRLTTWLTPPSSSDSDRRMIEFHAVSGVVLQTGALKLTIWSLQSDIPGCACAISTNSCGVPNPGGRRSGVLSSSSRERRGSDQGQGLSEEWLIQEWHRQGLSQWTGQKPNCGTSAFQLETSVKGCPDVWFNCLTVDEFQLVLRAEG
jgi:hypothetical protein